MRGVHQVSQNSVNFWWQSTSTLNFFSTFCIHRPFVYITFVDFHLNGCHSAACEDESSSLQNVSIHAIHEFQTCFAHLNVLCCSIDLLDSFQFCGHQCIGGLFFSGSFFSWSLQVWHHFEKHRNVTTFFARCHKALFDCFVNCKYNAIHFLANLYHHCR